MSPAKAVMFKMMFLPKDSHFGVAIFGHDVSAGDGQSFVAMDTTTVQVRTDSPCNVVSPVFLLLNGSECT